MFWPVLKQEICFCCIGRNDTISEVLLLNISFCGITPFELWYLGNEYEGINNTKKFSKSCREWLAYNLSQEMPKFEYLKKFFKQCLLSARYKLTLDCKFYSNIEFLIAKHKLQVTRVQCRWDWNKYIADFRPYVAPKE